jgi:hypothetical protein
MSDTSSLDYEPGVLRVFQSKSETKAFYNKIAKVYDPAECGRQEQANVGQFAC